MTESIQHILERRAQDSQHPKAPREIIGSPEATVRGRGARSFFNRPAPGRTIVRPVPGGARALMRPIRSFLLGAYLLVVALMPPAAHAPASSAPIAADGPGEAGATDEPAF